MHVNTKYQTHLSVAATPLNVTTCHALPVCNSQSMHWGEDQRLLVCWPKEDFQCSLLEIEIQQDLIQ